MGLNQKEPSRARSAPIRLLRTGRGRAAPMTQQTLNASMRSKRKGD